MGAAGGALLVTRHVGTEDLTLPVKKPEDLKKAISQFSPIQCAE
jgi:hypothetical protein